MSATFVQKLGEARQFLMASDFGQALGRYEKLARQWPQVAAVWFEYGNAASGARRAELAERCWQKAIALEPQNAELICLVGHQYAGARRPDRALASFAQAAAADPKGVNPRISSAVLLEKRHRLAEARAAVEECLALDPKDEQARYVEALLNRRDGRLEEAERGWRDLTAPGVRHPYVRYACRYELAQLLDETERADEAMRMLAEAKEIVAGLTDTRALLRAYDEGARRARSFTESQPLTICREWEKSFPAERREKLPPLAFLGGHPRSGTTLLEQTLDAHPEICALDESPVFLEVLQPEFHKTPHHSAQRLNVLRRAYAQAWQAEAGAASAGKTLVDKNPSPTARLPVWLRVFPELRVIIALRDPRDVALSCYFQNIPLNNVNANFLTLERVARHYADLMDIWLTVRKWEGFSWLETKYEAMVADLPAEGRRVTEFLGLTWQPGQAQFQEGSKTKAFYSPTYRDVTRPVYGKAVARWRRYEAHLAPILPALEPYCRALGYA